jgi:hypothetical protein
MECYIIRILYYFLTLEHLKTLYFAHFQSLLQYGIIFWGSTTYNAKEYNKSDFGIKTKDML